MAKKKTNKKPKSTNKPSGFQNIISNEKTDFLLGLILFIFAIYVITAMISYFNSGKADQSVLESMRPGQWLNTDHDFVNYCGSFGAIIAYTLITLNFGLPAFLIPAFGILVALQLMRAYKVNLLKWFFGMAVVMLWSSVTFAKFLTPLMGDQVFNPGGNHGKIAANYLYRLIGQPGLIGVLLATALIYLIYVSNKTVEYIRKALHPKVNIKRIFADQFFIHLYISYRPRQKHR